MDQPARHARSRGTGLLADDVGHIIVYGVSNNRASIWDNHMASALRYNPIDNAEVYREEIERKYPDTAPPDPADAYYGGWEVTNPIFGS